MPTMGNEHLWVTGAHWAICIVWAHRLCRSSGGRAHPPLFPKQCVYAEQGNNKGYKHPFYISSLSMSTCTRRYHSGHLMVVFLLMLSRYIATTLETACW